MNILILGGASKFGLYFKQHMTSLGHQVMSFGRPEVDFGDRWVPKVQRTLGNRWHLSDLDLVLVNVHDSDLDREGVQRNVLQTIWEVCEPYKRTTVAVMGSRIWQETQVRSTFREAKKSVHSLCVELSNRPHAARLMLIEPGPMANRQGPDRNPKTVLTYKQVTDTILTGFTLDLPFVHISMCGTHISEFKGELNGKV